MPLVLEMRCSSGYGDDLGIVRTRVCTDMGEYRAVALWDRDTGETIHLVNMTPHEVWLYLEECDITIFIEPCGYVPRVETRNIPVRNLYYGVGIKKVEYVASILPEPIPGVYYIVSNLVAMAYPDRKDLIVPDTSPGSVVKDDNGRIVAVRGFITYHDNI